MEVSVVITCWNGKLLLEKNLPSVLKAAKNPKNKIKEIIVVDDASADDSVEFLKNNFPEVKTIVHKVNQGYGAVCNDGVREAKGGLVVILNADVIPSEDFLVKSLDLFRDKEVFAVTFNEGGFGPGKVIWDGGFLGIQPVPPLKKVALSSWANGGSSIFRKDVWQKLGGMDSLFSPFYFEDIDLSLTAYRAGYKCLWDPAAKVVHKHESTINPQNFAKYNHKKNIAAIRQRNHLLLTWKLIDSFDLFFSHLSGLVKRCFLHPGYFKVVGLALLQAPKISRRNFSKGLKTAEVLKLFSDIADA